MINDDIMHLMIMVQVYIHQWNLESNPREIICNGFSHNFIG